MNSFGPKNLSARIAEPYRLLGDPSTLNEYIKAAVAASRTYFNLGSAMTNIYVDSTNGDNDTGDGTTGNPYQTIGRAYMDIPMGSEATHKIVLKNTDAPHDLDFTVHNATFVTIEGVPEVEETRNISSVSSTTTARGIVFDVDGATLTDEEWQGRILYVNDVLGNQRQIIVRHNDGNTIYGRMSSRTGIDSAQFSPAGGTVDLMKFPELACGSGSTIATANLEFTLSKVKITGDNLYIESGRMTIQYSEVDDLTQIGGEVFYISSSLNPNDGGDLPFIQSYGGNRVRFYAGCVITDRNITGTGYYLSVAPGGEFTVVGGLDIVGMNSLGIDVNAGIVAQAGWFVGSQSPIYFDDDLGSGSCEGGINCETDRSLGDFDTYRTVASQVYLAEAVGTIDGDYVVTGQRGTQATLDSACDVDTDLGTNTVSADGGTTNNWSAPDGTLILGGSPSEDFHAHYSFSNGDLGNGSTPPTQIIYNNLTGWRYTIGDDSVLTVELDHDVDTTKDVSLHIVWGINEAYATNSGEVQWQLDWTTFSSYTGNAASPTASGTEVTGDIDIPATANDVVHTTSLVIDAADIERLDIIGAKISRVALDGGNSPTAEPVILSVHLEYTRLY